jgi:hypothetical protein
MMIGRLRHHLFRSAGIGLVNHCNRLASRCLNRNIEMPRAA